MRALVLHPARSKPGDRAPTDALAEAVSLAGALDLDVVAAETVPLARARAGMLFGKGKIEELAALVAEREAGLVVIDGPLSPVQQAFHTTGRLYPEIPAYAYVRQTITGPIDPARLGQAFAELIVLRKQRRFSEDERPAERGGVLGLDGALRRTPEASYRVSSGVIARTANDSRGGFASFHWRAVRYSTRSPRFTIASENARYCRSPPPVVYGKRQS